MKSLIYRVNTSSYFSSEFQQKEMTQLQKINGNLQYTCCAKQARDSKVPLILITSTDSRDIDPQICQKTQLVLHPNSGYENLKQADFPTGTPIILGNQLRAQAVHQYILSALIQHFQKLPEQDQWQIERRWPRLLMQELKILIWGYGHVGQLLEKSLKAMNHQPDIIDPYQQAEHLLMSEKDVNLAHYDAVILACSLNVKNEKMINARLLQKLPRKCILINAARGKLIDQASLWQHAETHADFHAYLDVFDPEPFSAELKKLSNIHKSSHLAGYSQSLEEAVIQWNGQVIADFFHCPQSFQDKYKKDLLSERYHHGELI